MLRLLGEFGHVADEHDFEDGDYFYRFRASTHITASLDLTQVIEAVRGSGGFAVRDRSYHGKQFPNCFVGREAVAWLQQHYDLSAPGAVALGQTLLRLHLIRHVVDEHNFIDSGFFYRFN